MSMDNLQRRALHVNLWLQLCALTLLLLLAALVV